ncbi:hypothetical protein CEQ90_01415 [Lewinellaceae bacterium SD302]|nr:hypothetical protein CEQ90_01415 [Lewinellaceae bacterium SD302]
MDALMKLRYEGCLSTPALWRGEAAFPYRQITLKEGYNHKGATAVFKSRRLGKLVEELIFYQLKKQDSISWICDNLQIQDGKRTIGEIDALFYRNDQAVHLEVAYKFYLYDTLEQYDQPLGHWIGPNRNDRLDYKLKKLHDRQFSLLFNDLTKPYLERHGLKADQIIQKVCFKAQLFVPYGHTSFAVSPINSKCVVGYYISHRELGILSTCKFYLPQKIDWLIAPYPGVSWIDHSRMIEEVQPLINNGRSPLVWVKDKDDVLTKCFIVYW